MINRFLKNIITLLVVAFLPSAGVSAQSYGEVDSLSDTGSPVMIGVVIAIAVVAVVIGTFIVSRKQRNSLESKNQ